MDIDAKKLIEVIGRLIGRAESHLNAGKQTNCDKKREAHFDAYQDLMDAAHDLAQATSEPELVIKSFAYWYAVGEERRLKPEQVRMMKKVIG